MSKRFQGIKHYFLLSILSLVFFSCQRKEATEWNTKWKAPLLHGVLSFENILGDSLLKRGEAGNLIFVWKKSLSDFFFDDLISIPDTGVFDNFSLPFGSINLGPGDPILNQVKEMKFNVPNADLLFAKVKSGQVRVRLSNQVTEKIQLDYEIPSATLNGQVLSVSQLIDAATSQGPGTYFTSVDLTGYTLDLRGPGQNLSNTIYTRLNAMINPSGNSVLVTNQDSLIIELYLENIVVEYARGYFGKQKFVTDSQSTPFDFFNNRVSGQLQTDSMSIHLDVTNYAGFDAILKVNEFSSYNAKTGEQAGLNHQLIGIPQNITRASDYPLTPTRYSWDLSSGVSNIQSLLNIYPTSFTSGFELEVNPFGNISGGNDFLYTDNAFEIDLNIEAPISFYLESLVLADTLTVGVEDTEIPADLDETSLDLIVENSFPFSCYVEFYEFSNNVAGPLLIDQIRIEAATLLSDEKTTLPFFGIIPIPVARELLDKLRANNKVLMMVTLDTDLGGKPMRVYEGYKIDLSLVAKSTIAMKAGK
jgi:hypothetical protein